MKVILQLIENKKKEFEKLSFFEFIQNEAIPPEERLISYPCISVFALNFRDLNRYDYRDETSTEELQRIINIHTQEDARHWEWFLNDPPGRKFITVEGTISQGVRAFGLRKARYQGLAKVQLQHILTATAINFVRMVAWLDDIPFAQTRISRFALLHPNN